MVHTNKEQQIYGIPIENSICLVYGIIPNHCKVLTVPALKFHTEQLDYGVVFAEELDKYIYIAKNRNYERDTYVTVRNNYFLVGKEPKESWYLLRPDTILQTTDYLLSLVDVGISTLICSYGDSFVVSEESLINTLCYCWNNGY